MKRAVNIPKSYELMKADQQVDVVHTKEQTISSSVKYSFTRLYTSNAVNLEDANMLVYNLDKNNAAKNYLELRYCMTAEKYCAEDGCNKCNQVNASAGLTDSQLLDVFIFRFAPPFLSQFTQNVKLSDQKDEVLAFRHPETFTRNFPLCKRKRSVLNALFNHGYSGSLENIFVNAKIHELLLYSLECLSAEKEEVFSCKFLANDLDREKILKAKEVLLQHIGNPITIKALSRKVAINECYLKKGFKEIFGTTIFDFYQQQRMEHAKYLLYEKGLSVTDVSVLLGYSSISHFSTAFKKHTGLKPCELLCAGL